MWRSKIIIRKMLTYRVLCFVVLLCAINSVLTTEAIPIDGFKQCLISTPMSLGYCLGLGALTKLQSIDNNPEFDVVDGVTFTRDEQQIRETSNFIDRDAGDIRTIMDTVGQVFSRRSLRWDMSYLYPGLIMRVAPAINREGVLEFVMDPHREALYQPSLKEATTGRLITRQFLLPFLMGFKFDVSTLVPMMFGILAVISKKAEFIGKIGIMIGSVIGLGSLLFGSKYKPIGPSYGGTYGNNFFRVPGEEHYYADNIYRQDKEYNQEENGGSLSEIKQPYLREDRSRRNFAWNEAEKENKFKN